MTYVPIWAGSGSHTARMLGYCPHCGLYHGSPAARLACADFLAAAAESRDELAAWRLLKDAVVREQAPYPGPIVTSTPAEPTPRRGRILTRSEAAGAAS